MKKLLFGSLLGLLFLVSGTMNAMNTSNKQTVNGSDPVTGTTVTATISGGDSGAVATAHQQISSIAGGRIFRIPGWGETITGFPGWVGDQIFAATSWTAGNLLGLWKRTKNFVFNKYTLGTIATTLIALEIAMQADAVPAEYTILHSFYKWEVAQRNALYEGGLPTAASINDKVTNLMTFLATNAISLKDWCYDIYLMITNVGVEHYQLKKMCEHYNSQWVDASSVLRMAAGKIGLGNGNELAAICAPFKK